jgi:dipeptidyl aminopeptidase/acylaminoacyl peptidase
MRASSLLLAVLLVSIALADPNKPSASKSAKWTIDDVIAAESAGDFQLSPDGRWAVWVKTTLDADKDEHVGQVMRTDLKELRTIELTRGQVSCINPRWSPDGKQLAFLSARPAPKTKDKHPSQRRPNTDKARTSRKGDDDEAKQQIWLIDPFGGEAWRLTDYPRSVNAFEWADNDRLFFSAQEEASQRETVLKDDKKDTSIVVEDEKHEPPVRLFQVVVKDKSITRLTDNTDRIESFAVARGGDHVVSIHSRSLRYTYDNKIKPIVLLHDRKIGQRKQIFKDPVFNISGIYWTADGKGFYAANDYCSQPQLNQASITELYYQDLDKDTPDKVDLDWDRGLSLQWDNHSTMGLALTKDGFVAILADGVRGKTAHFTRQEKGWKREWITGENADRIHGLQVAADGKTLVYAHSTASKPVQWYHAKLAEGKLGKPDAITELNENFEDLPRAKTEIMNWKGALNEEVEGVLYYPHDYQPGKKYALVVMIHGGPASADLDSWEESWAYAANQLCQRGAFVLKPNYHGSSNYGLAWLESISRGKYLDLETVDIEKGVDHLIGKGMVDPAKLGLMGWSNGAILTNALTVRTTRYKAAVAGAGTIEYISDWANCEFGEAFDRYYLGKSPLEDVELYLRKSPFFKLDKVKTPTLLLFGTEDRVVPTEQGWVHYRGLQQLGKTPVRFVLFPDEKHSIKKPAHQRRKLEEELAWFDQHLFGAYKEPNEALKKTSPLAWALQRRTAQRSEGRFGVVEAGVLLPETVAHAGLHIGRFEVTVAQYRQFDPKWRAEDKLADDMPVNGVAFEQAREYCAWLSKTTGKTYRLPNAEEADTLYDKSEPGENTLDYWAGYAVNPDDARRLKEKIKELGGNAPLLREVGRFRGDGEEDLVFDLGGNVAEWTTDKNGKGVPRGGSADAPANPRLRISPAAPEYRGFRVVRVEEKK